MTQPTCFGCSAILDSTNDSRAHIIPNALGGRLAPKGLICQTCNTRLDRLADNALVNVFAQWPTLLNIPRQGGSNPPVVIKDTQGTEYRVDKDGERTLARSSYDVQAIGDEHHVEIKAPTTMMAKQRIAQAAKQFPVLDEAQALSHARTVSAPIDDEWHVRMNFGPHEAFPGVMTALWLYHLQMRGQPFMPWADLVNPLEAEQFHNQLRYTPDGLPGLSGSLSDMSHLIVLKSVPSKKLLIGYVQVLGVLRIGGVLSEDYAEDIEHIYAADPMSVLDQSGGCSIDPSIFDQTDWPAWGLTPTTDNIQAIKDSATKAMGVLKAAFDEREKTL